MKEVVELRTYLIRCSHDPCAGLMCINQSYCDLSPSPVPMHRRVTHLGTSLRKQASATKSLIYRPRRTFSTTRAHHTTHYDTLSIPRNASKSQIKVSTLATQSNSLCLMHPLVRLLQGTHSCMPNSIQNETNSTPYVIFYFAPSPLQTCNDLLN